MCKRACNAVLRNTGAAWKRKAVLFLRDAVKEQNRHIAKLGSRIAARFAKAGLSTDLPELHGHILRSAEFGK